MGCTASHSRTQHVMYTHTCTIKGMLSARILTLPIGQKWIGLALCVKAISRAIITKFITKIRSYVCKTYVCMPIPMHASTNCPCCPWYAAHLNGLQQLFLVVLQSLLSMLRVVLHPPYQPLHNSWREHRRGWCLQTGRGPPVQCRGYYTWKWLNYRPFANHTFMTDKLGQQRHVRHV